MFGTKKSEENSVKAAKVSIEKLTTIALGTMVNGTLAIDGNLRLDGTIEGDVSCNGKVVLGPQGKIKGNVTCVSAVLHGKLQGDIHVTDDLVLKSECVMSGVYTCKLEIEPKARFNGACNTTERNTPVADKNVQTKESVVGQVKK
ncbi:MAG: polymer-forming cytoskeletal protein [Bacteroides sp.]|nr:polymer-forming cytoskeletal protein [Bacteroides sp.]